MDEEPKVVVFIIEYGNGFGDIEGYDVEWTMLKAAYIAKQRSDCYYHVAIHIVGFLELSPDQWKGVEYA